MKERKFKVSAVVEVYKENKRLFKTETVATQIVLANLPYSEERLVYLLKDNLLDNCYKEIRNNFKDIGTRWVPILTGFTYKEIEHVNRLRLF